MSLDSDCFLLKTFKVTAQEASIARYSRDILIQGETLLEHIGWVSTWSYLVAQDMQKELDINVEYDVLLKAAVIHDIDEICTGDVPSPTKYANSEILAAFKAVEDVSVKWIVKDLELEESSIYQEWRSSKDVSTLEGYLVKLADVASVVYKVWHEVLLLGNNSFARVANEVLKILETMKTPNWFSVYVAEAEYLTRLLDDMIAVVRRAVDHTDGLQNIVAKPLDMK